MANRSKEEAIVARTVKVFGRDTFVGPNISMLKDPTLILFDPVGITEKIAEIVMFSETVKVLGFVFPDRLPPQDENKYPEDGEAVAVTTSPEGYVFLFGNKPTEPLVEEERVIEYVAGGGELTVKEADIVMFPEIVNVLGFEYPDRFPPHPENEYPKEGEAVAVTTSPA